MGYREHYEPTFWFVWQYGDNWKFSGLEYYQWLCVKLNIFQKPGTWVPGFAIRFVLLGVGVDFCSHQNR